MIHPLKAATSFECDGCGHHASFHKMENRQEEEAVEEWRLLQQFQEAQQAPALNQVREATRRAETRLRQRGRLRENDFLEVTDADSDDGVRVIEDVQDVPRQARKRQRAGAR
ncbi:MAG: hypothetical protein LQ338_004168 [Usnochroma carphineum]|nr:MAG: hypothetical protein LQ338_004168 [Usnochroma carphineum]